MLLIFFCLGYVAVGLGVAIGIVLTSSMPPVRKFLSWVYLWPLILWRWAQMMRDR